MAADEVAQRAGHEEILLDEAELLAVLGLVVRIKNLRHGLADGFFAHGLDVAAGVEGAQVELFGGTRSPKAQEIHRLGAVAGDGNIVGHAEDLLRVDPTRKIAAAVVEHVFHPAVELDLLRVFGTADFPRRAKDHPVVGMLDLVTVHEFLLKKAELVVDAVADCGIVERGEGIQEAGGKTAQAAVAQPHVHFDLAEFIEIYAEFGERGPGGFG